MEVWNNKLLVREGKWDDVTKALETVKSSVIDNTAQKISIPASKGIRYWSQIPQSPLNIGLFYIQHSPIWLYNTIRSRKVKFNRHQILAFFFSGIEIFRKEHWFTAICAFAIGKYRNLTTALSFKARQCSKEKCSELNALRVKSNAIIGKLLDSHSSGNAVNDIKHFAQVLNIDLTQFPDIDTPEVALDVLQYILTVEYSRTSQNVVSFIPSFYIRWWPAVIFVVYAVRKLQGSWHQVIDWFRESVLETVKSFWRNWVIDPFYHIYLTIRHDPTSQLALIANESLDTDINSLNGMIADFVRDNQSSLKSSSIIADDTQADMTPVMNAYEKELRRPIRGIIAGELLRTALIQVQKSKVDLEVALSGIDQLLQSQQLVFGLVAAIPAFSAIVWLSLTFSRTLSGKQLNRSTAVKKLVLENLGDLDTIVRENDVSITDENVGHIYCKILQIKQECSVHSNSVTVSQMFNGLDRVLSTVLANRDPEKASRDLDRVYIRFR